jgi:hypothetical protein
MAQMKNHIAHGVIAAAVAAAVSTAALVTMPTKRVAALEHAWPGLSAQQKVDLGNRLREIPGRLQLDIVCIDASCSDLAEDIDDAGEQAGIVSQLDHVSTPLGYGIGVKADTLATAQQVAKAISDASGGVLSPEAAADRTFGYAVIFIGKHRD